VSFSVIRSKYYKLKEILGKYGSLLVAYSGGVDSSLLLKVAHDVLGGKVLAVIAASETYPQVEGKAAVKFARKLGVRHKLIRTKEFNDERFLSNPPERCYYCKDELFSQLRAIAKKEGIKYVADGSNVSDLSDFRPGSNASKKHGVKSPLREAGFTKDDIRELSKELKLPTWNKPQLACLASRIPYGTRITKEILKKIDKGEKFLRSLGLSQVRVRHHGDLARIEADKCDLASLVEDGIADRIDKKFRDLGYKFVTIDLAGYRTGSMNEILTSVMPPEA
jgi:pyridinium-3,5-biscarboxylic acid mononucleotide sulfurtransferase